MISKFLKSSLIYSVSYENYKLLVNFTNGTSYVYYNVPYQVYEELINSDSPGKFYNTRIRGRFSSKRGQ